MRSDKTFFEKNRADIVGILEKNGIVRASAYFEKNDSRLYLQGIPNKPYQVSVKNELMKFCTDNSTIYTFTLHEFTIFGQTIALPKGIILLYDNTSPEKKLDALILSAGLTTPSPNSNLYAVNSQKPPEPKKPITGKDTESSQEFSLNP